jgi:hypothetical protein
MRNRTENRRYFQIAGITVCVERDPAGDRLEFTEAFEPFAVERPGEDMVILRHCFEWPDLKGVDLGKELYRKAPWSISRNDDRWFYLGINSEENNDDLNLVGIFTADHRQGTIYHPKIDREASRALSSGWHSLSRFSTDQVWLAPLLADRDAVLLHSAGVILNGRGLLFVGHSDAGKSTTVTMLKGRVEILCDDRNIARRWDSGWRIHGTWSHGDVTDVSAASAPLRAILFLEQSNRNAIVPLTDRKEIWRRLLATLIKAAVTAEWWHKEMDVLERLVGEVPCFTMHFDKTGGIVPELENLR